MQTLKDYLAAARAEVESISAARAKELTDQGALLLDIRDTAEVGVSGKASGAINVPRGFLEFRADPDSPFHLDAFRRDRPVVVYCASGGRAALAGKTLKEMG